MKPLLHALTFLSLLLIPSAYAQTCENYGTPNGSSCSCPTGFGGPTCSQPGCHGTIFAGSQRQFVTPSSGLANLTASGCGCESGWGGTGCNVCRSAAACQTGFAAHGSAPTDSTTVTNVQNGTMVCNTTPRVWAASQMSCQVIVRPPSASSHSRIPVVT